MALDSMEIEVDRPGWKGKAEGVFLHGTFHTDLTDPDTSVETIVNLLKEPAEYWSKYKEYINSILGVTVASSSSMCSGSTRTCRHSARSVRRHPREMRRAYTVMSGSTSPMGLASHWARRARCDTETELSPSVVLLREIWDGDSASQLLDLPTSTWPRPHSRPDGGPSPR